MTQLFKNNAQGALVAELSESGTLVMLAAGHGGRFPAPTNGDHFLATLVGLNANGQENAWEIVKCTGRATDGLTIVRAQEGTTARTWSIGTRFEMRVTAGTLDGFTTAEQAGQVAPVQSVAGKKGEVTLEKADVGLSKVDNTADADKPVSTAVQHALAGKEAAGAAAAAVTAHAQALDPHPQYQAKLESGVTIKTVNGKSLLGKGNVVIASGGVTLDGDAAGFIHEDKVYVITNYNAFSQYTARASAGQASVKGDKIRLKLPATAGDVTLTVSVDGAETEFTVRVKPAGVYAPRGTGPLADTLIETPAVTLAASAFVPSGVPDTHASSDWQLASDPNFGTVLQSLNASTSSLTSWAVAGLQPSQTYYWRVRYRGAQNGESDWSEPMTLRTASEFLGLVGEPGTQGFGVGVYPGELPEGFAEMEGTRNKASDNYGNYTYSDGSVMVFVPKFYYRYGHRSSPRRAKYGENCLDIAGAEVFANEAQANGQGYALHRAFIDGGEVKGGFFIDKYLISKEGGAFVSKKNGIPVSLSNQYAQASTYPALVSGKHTQGRAFDAVLIARARKEGVFNVPSAFMYSALSMLSLAHGQASKNSTYCAWYDSTHNFPKGCNNEQTGDVNDSSVNYQVGNYDYAFSRQHIKPKTGSGWPFAKTTHNGQSCGIADVNGVLTEMSLGVTTPGTSDSQGGLHSETSLYVLKPEISLSSLTEGWNNPTDAWQSHSNISKIYKKITYFAPPSSYKFGNGSKKVFDASVSGDGYLMTCAGLPLQEGASSYGTNLFGSDAANLIRTHNMFVAFSGNNTNGTSDYNKGGAGVFSIYSTSRHDPVFHLGFRAAAYGD